MRLIDDWDFPAEGSLGQHAKRVEQFLFLLEEVLWVDVGDAIRLDVVFGEDVRNYTWQVDRHGYGALNATHHDLGPQDIPIFLQLLELSLEQLLHILVPHDVRCSLSTHHFRQVVEEGFTV